MNARVYRCYDAQDRLLYVGCTTQRVDYRLTQHRSRHRRQRRKSWTELVARVDVEEFDALADAASAEMSAIWHEGPLFNIVGGHCSALGYPSVAVIAYMSGVAPETLVSAANHDPKPSLDEWRRTKGAA